MCASAGKQAARWIAKCVSASSAPERRITGARSASLQHLQHLGNGRHAQTIPRPHLAPHRIFAFLVDEDRPEADTSCALELVVRAVADKHGLVRLDAELLAARE